MLSPGDKSSHSRKKKGKKKTTPTVLKVLFKSKKACIAGMYIVVQFSGVLLFGLVYFVVLFKKFYHLSGHSCHRYLLAHF